MCEKKHFYATTKNDHDDSYSLVLKIVKYGSINEIFLSEETSNPVRNWNEILELYSPYRDPRNFSCEKKHFSARG